MNNVIFGDCRTVMRDLIDQGVKVQMCVCSPPYWGLRSYLDSEDGNKSLEIGSEKTPEEYVANMVEVFRLVRELLRDDGTLWLNLGDSYSTSGGSGSEEYSKRHIQFGKVIEQGSRVLPRTTPDGLKPKDLCGIPWRVAFALQADGWYLRSDIIWHKPNPMPESVTDRPTKSHEYLFLMSKNAKYYFDQEAVKEKQTEISIRRAFSTNNVTQRKDSKENIYAISGEAQDKKYERMRKSIEAGEQQTRNIRTVWTIPTSPYSGAHFATFPPKLIEPCIMAGSKVGDIVLDPFIGSGTTGEVCEALGRKWIGIELNEKYGPLCKERTRQQGLFCGIYP